MKSIVIEKSNSINQLAMIDINKAEEALDLVAHKYGDELAMRVVENMNPIVIAKMMCSRDESSPSLLNWITSPKQVRKVIEVDPARWSDIMKPENIADIVDIVNNFLYGLLINMELDERKELIDELTSSDAARLYIHIGLASKDNKSIFRLIKECSTLAAERLQMDIDKGGFVIDSLLFELRENAQEKIMPTVKEEDAFKPLEV